jgi:hypothetical protein
MSNPAHRLHTILFQSKQQELQNKNMMIGWRAVLQLPDQLDDLFIMNKVGKVFTLPSIIADQIKRFPDLDTELYLGWREDLASAFKFVNFNSQFAEFSRRLSDSLLINIRFCAHELDKRAPEKDISREELDKLRESTWSLYEEVLKADLPPSLSRYLLDYLYLIIEAIDDYHITGAVGMERALNAVLGTVITDQARAQEVRQSAFGERFWMVVTKVGVALKLAKTAAELANGVRKLLVNQ